MKRLLTVLGCLLLVVAAKAQLYVSANTPFYISDGNTVAVTKGDVTMHGNITGAGTGELLMNGTVVQNIFTNSYSIYGLEVKNQQNVLLNGNLTIPGGLKLTGGSFSINGNQLTLSGTIFTNSGNLLGSRTSQLILSSSNPLAGIIYFNPTGNLIENLFVNNSGSGGFKLGDTLQVVNTLSLQSGALASNGNLVLKSDTLGTAYVSAVGSGSITGNVVVQRYIPAGRAWRFLTAPLSNSGSIYANWQNNGIVSGNTGAEMWSPSGTGSGGNGLLQGGVSASIETLDPTSNTFNGLTNTNQLDLDSTMPSAANKAFGVFVTGPYGSGKITAGDTSTTLIASGQLQTGSQLFNYKSVPAGNFVMVGNPYASPVDFTNVGATGASSGNINNIMWAWDAKRSGTSLGGYVSFSWDATTNSYDQAPDASQTKQTIDIQSGQAILVQADTTTHTNGTPENVTVTFNENDKVASSGTNQVFGVTIPTAQVNIGLNRQQNNGMLPVDGVLVKFGSNYSQGVSDDADKMYNYDENLALRINNKYLSIERRPMPTRQDTLFLDIYALKKSSSYSFTISPTNINLAEGVQPYLVDKFLKTTTPISFTSSNTVPFTTTTAAGSSSETRFAIVFNSGTALATTITNVKAWQQTKGIQVQWTAETETGIKDYEVEKSSDALHFVSTDGVAAIDNGNSQTYGWLDANPNNGDNYYRIRIINNDGSINYSDVVLVKLGMQAAFRAYPNPVKTNEQLSVELNGMPAGKYTLQVFGPDGSSIAQRVIENNGNSTTNAQIVLPKLAPGVYQLVLLDEKGGSHEQKVVVE